MTPITNILVSAGLLRSSRLAALAERVSDEHTLVLSSQIIDELRMVMDMKFPHKKAACEAFLNKLSFEMVLTPRYVDPSIYPRIRDKSDYPILASAIIADVDVFITGARISWHWMWNVQRYWPYPSLLSSTCSTGLLQTCHAEVIEQ